MNPKSRMKYISRFLFVSLFILSCTLQFVGCWFGYCPVPVMHPGCGGDVRSNYKTEGQREGMNSTNAPVTRQPRTALSHVRVCLFLKPNSPFQFFFQDSLYACTLTNSIYIKIWPKIKNKDVIKYLATWARVGTLDARELIDGTRLTNPPSSSSSSSMLVTLLLSPSIVTSTSLSINDSLLPLSDWHCRLS